MPVVLATLLPDFALILLGGLIGRRTGREAWRGIDWLNFNLLLPSLLFVAASSRPVTLGDLGVIGLSVWTLMALGLGLGLLLRPRVLRIGGAGAALDFAGQWQTCWRFSSPLAFVAVAAFPPSVQALMGVAVGAGVPMANLLAVWALSRGNGLSLRATLLRAATNPFLLASLGGLALGLTGLHAPALLMRLLGRLSDAAIPMALLSMGASLDWRALHRPGWAEAGMVGIKLLALPVAALLIGVLLDLPLAQRTVLLLIAAVPTAPSAHILSAAFGADPRPTATLIAQGTLAAMLTLPFWMAVALHL